MARGAVLLIWTKKKNGVKSFYVLPFKHKVEGDGAAALLPKRLALFSDVH